MHWIKSRVHAFVFQICHVLCTYQFSDVNKSKSNISRSPSFCVSPLLAIVRIDIPPSAAYMDQPNLPPLSSPQSRSNTPTGSPLPRCHCSRQVRTMHTIRTASLADSTPACTSVLVYRHPRLQWAGFRDSLYMVCNR